ncbi:MAG: hypothetical protein ABH824_00730 [Nanoarchaeota archaeon]|nr:hypothetical protein [Nanoarchaeota archaeon]MBU1631662.1 hypothetical protein [Nanoarchaeota archaeon]MBU1875632.1 hypothetical protein [Nanoarchaeota archaeon]
MKRFPKRKTYGSYKTTDCPFCGKIATQKNEQGLDVCRLHTKSSLQEIKCTCGKWLEVRSGKFGPYFTCINCGNFNYNKAMEIKNMTTPIVPIERKFEEISHTPKKKMIKENPKEITITSNDVEYFD